MSTEGLPVVPERTAQQVQDERLLAVPALYKMRHEQLAVELALRTDEPDVIFERYGYTIEAGAALLESPGFSKLLEKVSVELQDGLSFKLKVRAIAEDLLPYAHEIATDPVASTAERVKLIQWAAKVAGYEPKEAKDDGKQGGGLNLTIQFAGQAPMKVVQHEPVTITQEAP